jgi:fatty acid amide hydrolase 2
MEDKDSLAAQILDMDAMGLVELYKKGKIKPSDAIDIYIRHQKRFNSKLNLVVEERYEKSRQEAVQYDALLEKGEMKGKLFGVPMSIKESFDIAGMHTTGSLKHNKDRLVQEDGEIIKRLRSEGAIILDKTNTPSLCFCQETDNNLFGRSNNPWNPGYTTGGSSGGEAGLIAVGGAAGGLGSDIGGSIRIPAHFNGVVGFKPGAFQYPLQGHYPDFETENQKHMTGFGPLVKSVRDAALLYSIIHPEFQPPTSWELPKELSIHSFGSFYKTRCTVETENILQRARELLGEAGAKVRTDVPQFMKEVALIWQLIMSEDSANYVANQAYPGRAKFFTILFDYLQAFFKLKNPHNHPYLSWGIIGARLFTPGKKGKTRIREFVQKYLTEIEDMLGSTGVFVIPTYPSPAKKHGKVYWEIFSIRKTFRWVLPFICLANVFGLPALVVPCSRSQDGLPIGLQVVSTVGNERLVFQVASFLESSFGGYRRNQSYDSSQS